MTTSPETVSVTVCVYVCERENGPVEDLNDCHGRSTFWDACVRGSSFPLVFRRLSRLD